MDPSQCDYRPMTDLTTEDLTTEDLTTEDLTTEDLTTEDLTTNVNLINYGCRNSKLKSLIKRLVEHIDDFARETRLSMAEWEASIDFVTREFVLFSDVIGLSLLVDAIDHPKLPGATEGTVLGLFHTHDANDVSNGDDTGSDPDGEPLLVYCSIEDTLGQPVSGVKVNVWETASKGFYDVQYANRDGPKGRAVLHSDQEGIFRFKAIVSVSYLVPVDGPVGEFLRTMGRHPYRPAHVHFMFERTGFDQYVTVLTLRGDP